MTGDTEYAGRGDPRRSLELLWRRTTAPTRGPKPALSVDEIVAAAIQLADVEGLAALSMRRVGEQLGRSAMSIYTYVPGKAELLDLMVDAAIAEAVPPPRSADTSWRDATEAFARQLWTMYERHPWVLQIAGARAALGPNEFDYFEATISIVDGIGLSGLDMARVVSVVTGYVRGAAKAVADAVEAERVTGISDDDWWSSRAPLLEELSASGNHPTIGRLSAEGTFSQPHRDPADATPYTVFEALDSFEFGLQRLLDGIAVYVAGPSER